MCNIPHVTIDASVLAVPQIGCSLAEAISYIENIIDWSILLDEPWVDISLTERSPSALFLDELYPLRDHLRTLFTSHHITEFDVNTVARVVDRLLNLTPSFESYFKIIEILFEEDIDTDPDIIRLVATPKLRFELARCVLLLAILRLHCKQPLGGHSLILRHAPAALISVRAKIHEIEHDRADINNLVYQPDFFTGDLLACDNFRGLIECLDELSILTGADDELGIEIAIRVYSYKEKLRRKEEPEWDSLIIPRIGHEFRRTCQSCCHDQGNFLPPRILRSIFHTIENERLELVHALRRGPGPNDAQITRNRDRAQRRDIDHEFHLHYWLCEDGNIELASVVYHHDVAIPD